MKKSEKVFGWCLWIGLIFLVSAFLVFGFLIFSMGCQNDMNLVEHESYTGTTVYTAPVTKQPSTQKTYTFSGGYNGLKLALKHEGYTIQKVSEIWDVATQMYPNFFGDQFKTYAEVMNGQQCKDFLVWLGSASASKNVYVTGIKNEWGIANNEYYTYCYVGYHHGDQIRQITVKLSSGGIG